MNLWTTASMIWIAAASTAGEAQNPDETSQLQFFCNTGYSAKVCQAQIQRLRDELSKFDLRALGTWTWILVRSEDWKPILYRAGRDPDSPAFTILAKRQTFLEEALFAPTPVRGRTLLEKFRLPLDQLLGFAVAHELGHALCRETSEEEAGRSAHELRHSGKVSCEKQDP